MIFYSVICTLSKFSPVQNDRYAKSPLTMNDQGLEAADSPIPPCFLISPEIIPVFSHDDVIVIIEFMLIGRDLKCRLEFVVLDAQINVF